MYSYKYPRPAVTADCVVMSEDHDGKRQVLLIKRKNPPYKGCWAFPGGFMEMDETLEQCALRELYEETGLKVAGKIVELKSFSAIDRDPRGRCVTVAFLIEIPMAEVHGSDDAVEARWWPLDNLPQLAFDHKEILHVALEKTQ